MKFKVSTLIILAILSFPLSANAETIVGLEFAPTFGLNSDFNNENSKSKFHLNMGANAAFSLMCHSRFCEGLFIEASLNYIFSSNYNFGSTQVRSTGQIGNYSESLSSIIFSAGIKKYFTVDNRINPFASIQVGYGYLKVSNQNYTDSLGTSLTLNTSTSSSNAVIRPSIGVSYKLSQKMFIEAAPRFSMFIPQFTNGSFFEFPVSVKLAF